MEAVQAADAMTAPVGRTPLTEKLRADIAHVVRSTRKQRQFSQQRLADAVGVSRATISRIEHGQLDDILIGSVAKALAWCDFELSITISRRPT